MLKLDSVSYSYGGDALLSGITLDIPAGGFFFLTGPSGAGKTTFLKLCYGALLPTSGRLDAFGQDVRSMNRDEIAGLRRRIGVVHQDCAFLDHLPVAENVALPLTVSDRAAEADNLDELLGWVGLTDQAQALPPQLSGGERQRAALARAVIVAPEIVIADEPTGNIDWDMSLRLLTLLVELNKMGKTILIATHDLTLIRQAKTMVQARVLRIRDRNLQQAGADL